MTQQIPFDTSGNVSFTGTPSPLPQIQGQYGSLEKGYADTINAQPTVPQLTAKYNTQFGVPQLQGQVANDQATEDKLNTAINMAPKTVAQASQQSILTQGQKDAAVTNLTAPLNTQLATATTDASRTQSNLGTAQTNAGNMVSAEQAQQQKQLLPWTQAFSDANVTSAMQMTGWSTENAQQLQVLLANQSAGVTMTEDERNNMEKLAEQEQTFENTLKINAAKPMVIGASDLGVYSNGQITSGSAWS